MLWWNILKQKQPISNGAGFSEFFWGKNVILKVFLGRYAEKIPKNWVKSIKLTVTDTFTEYILVIYSLMNINYVVRSFLTIKFFS